MREAIEKLMRIHYQFFMANPRFWHEDAILREDGSVLRLGRVLVDADAYICIAASNLRQTLGGGGQ